MKKIYTSWLYVHLLGILEPFAFDMNLLPRASFGNAQRNPVLFSHANTLPH